jgi:hypothetical protein
MEVCGFKDLGCIRPSKLFRRVSEQEMKSFEQIYFREKGTPLANHFYSFLN